MAENLQAAPVNQLVDAGNPGQTIDRCMDVIEYVRQSTTTDVVGEDIDMGRFLVLGLVHDALKYVDHEIHALRTRVVDEKEVAITGTRTDSSTNFRQRVGKAPKLRKNSR